MCCIVTFLRKPGDFFSELSAPGRLFLQEDLFASEPTDTLKHMEQGTAHFFDKGPVNKHFWLCRP